jgi:two-component system cell cycle sensor histidine kinase/response regulator CckA
MPDKILVIDDDPDFRKLMKHILSGNGYDVELKPSAQTGLAYFQDNCENIKLVIIDILMPGMMGPELAKRLRSLQPTIKLLFASAYALEIMDQDTQSAFPLIRKPVGPQQVIERVREVLGEESSAVAPGRHLVDQKS